MSGAVAFPHPYYGSEGTAEAFAFHPGGANFALGDGSVRFIAKTITMRDFARLVTRGWRSRAVGTISVGRQLPPRGPEELGWFLRAVCFGHALTDHEMRPCGPIESVTATR